MLWVSTIDQLGNTSANPIQSRMDLIISFFFKKKKFNSSNDWNTGDGSQTTHNQMAGALDKECSANNNMATNYTVNGNVQKESNIP